MKAFEVFLNGDRLCLAGLTGRCVLTVIISHVKGKVDPVDEVDLQVGGLISDTDEHVLWRIAQLNTDDEVRVKIIESDSADEPTKRVLRDSEEDLKQRKAYVRAMAKQLGWALTESGDSTAESTTEMRPEPVDER